MAQRIGRRREVPDCRTVDVMPCQLNYSFHHVGVACRDLAREAEAFSILGYAPEGDEFVDQRQGIRGMFLVGGGPRLELLVGLPDSSVLEPWLRKGIKFYHHAFMVDDISRALNEFIARRAIVVVDPVPAVAFAGREIAFVMLRNMSLVELIQK